MELPLPLPGLLTHLAPLLSHYGYWAVGAVVFVGDFGVPAPGETILLAAGIYARGRPAEHRGRRGDRVRCGVAGDNVGYLIGRLDGRAFVHRWGRYVFLAPERFHKAEAFFTRHGGKGRHGGTILLRGLARRLPAFGLGMT
ncbi:DedA family protein [Streptomyces sp. NPDC047725]|uniref:DedA family protein n=1 Tax=Streptomyces sp. NPDC047725 TaxID=3365487 RepID=UPI00371C8500